MERSKIENFERTGAVFIVRAYGKHDLRNACLSSCLHKSVFKVKKCVYEIILTVLRLDGIHSQK